MANTRLLPGAGNITESTTNTRMVPGIGMVTETVGGAPPVAGAVMNQLQSSNLGADLYNGTIQ
ncbi:MAG: hypothetical protein ABUK15_07360 [Anaerolineales bacterium]